MYKLSQRREMIIEMGAIAVKQPLGTVALPISCWKALITCMADIDALIPRLKQGLKVKYQKSIGAGWIVKVTQCYQCIVIRRQEWKTEKDIRQILLIVDIEWNKIHQILPLILSDAEEKARPKWPVYSYILPDERFIPGLTLINPENGMEIDETKEELAFLRIPTSNMVSIKNSEK